MKAALLVSLLTLAAVPAEGAFTLASTEQAAVVVVPSDERGCVRLAAEDLNSDVKKITGDCLLLTDQYDTSSDRPRVVLVSVNVPASNRLCRRLDAKVAEQLEGKWEAYRVRLVSSGKNDPPTLLIAGSDARGTMFGLYALIERYLDVDPLYYWADRPPMSRPSLRWEDIALASDGPTIHYRGWFINDEDLLTEWHLDGGRRDIDYPFYDRVVSPRASQRIFEAMLRLRMNLVIPASFVDIRNPDERRLIDEATRRGLLVSQHHIEPLGVSGFGYLNYWRDRGEPAPYSFTKHPERFEQVWRDYAARWARYGDQVVWQLGLRGIADQPIWAADDAAPKTDAGRGKLISDAMALQRQIILDVDTRENPPMTTTLWMEGARLHEQGHLRFPPGVAVVFSDNSPGWRLQDDFHQVKRQPDRHYGIYYHQALWNSGPHLVQGVSPWKMHDIFRQAIERDSAYYIMMNVSNVREFVLGLDAASKMLWNFESFEPKTHLTRWCEQRFGPAAQQAEQCYRRLFDAFVRDDGSGKRRFMDGDILGLGQRVTRIVQQRFTKGERPIVQAPDALRQRLAMVRRQLAAARRAGEGSQQVLDKLDGPARRLFETNFVAQQQILVGLLGWTEGALGAALALNQGDRAGAAHELQNALDAMQQAQDAQRLAARGKWENWYRGDKKMNLAQARRRTTELLHAIRE